MKHRATVIRTLFLVLFLVLIWKGKMMLWLALFAFSLGLALLFGRVYCGYVCPMHTLMIPVEKLGQRLKWQTNEHPRWLDSGVFPGVALVASVATMALARRVLRVNLPILLIWLGASVLITLRYKQEVFHNLICPFGALQRLFGKGKLFAHWVDKARCTGCRLCEKVCPSQAVVVDHDRRARIDTSLCLQCSACREACRKEAISYAQASAF
ncbi:MAG: 4Fe-4S binding protein [Limnochordia bacterium]|jgi:ferredoxin-type protein NapH